MDSASISGRADVQTESSTSGPLLPTPARYLAAARDFRSACRVTFEPPPPEPLRLAGQVRLGLGGLWRPMYRGAEEGEAHDPSVPRIRLRHPRWRGIGAAQTVVVEPRDIDGPELDRHDWTPGGHGRPAGAGAPTMIDVRPPT